MNDSRGQQSSEPAGMGPTPSGPAFSPWYAGSPDPDGGSAPAQVPQVPTARDFRTRSNRLPAVLTALAVVMVGLVVAVASLLAVRSDARPVGGRAIPIPTPAASVSSDRIEFSTSDGSGVLVIRDHAWENDPAAAPASGTFLSIEVEIVCRSGEVEYAPYQFQAFDRQGQLFDVVDVDHPSEDLDIGTLTAGQSVRGRIAFDMSRGDVTLLLSDDTSQSVTALKIPD